MTTITSDAPVSTAPRKRRAAGNFRRTLRTGRGRVGLTLVVFVVAAAAIGPFVTPSPPDTTEGIFFSPASSRFWLGTDVLGRSVLARVLDGGWVLLIMATAATVIGVGLGAIIGMSAAYFRGRIDTVLMRAVDILLAFPQIVLVLLLISVVGSKLWLIVLAVAFSHLPAVARVIRSASIDVTERDFIASDEAIALRRTRILFGEVLPNVVSPLMVESGLRLAWSTAIIAGLSLLGFGQAPPAPGWGEMIYENISGISTNPWGVLAPALMIAALTIGVNTLTDAFARVSMGSDRGALEIERLQ
jgi:peptide/nickel transport system permease protein